MSSPVCTLPLFAVVWMLWATSCHSQPQGINISLCIDDRDCTRQLTHVCVQGTCIPKSDIQCPEFIYQIEGDDVLVSHLRPVTIEPSGGTCGEDRNNSFIGMDASSPATAIYINYRNFQGIESLDDPGQNFGSGQPPIPVATKLPFLEDNLIFQACGVEETICSQRHPRDQKLLIHLPDRQVIGGPQCTRDQAQDNARKRRQAENQTEILCALQIGEGFSGFTGDSMFAFKMLLGSATASVGINLPGGYKFIMEIFGRRIVHGFIKESPNGFEITVPRVGVWYHIAVQFRTLNIQEDGQVFASIFLDGVYQLEVFATFFEAGDSANESPVASINPLQLGETLHIEDVRFYNRVLTNREIHEVFSGEFPKLDIFSDCLCPTSHSRALVDTAGLDLYCSLNQDETRRVRRDNPPSDDAPFTTNAGLYIPEFLSDGEALPFPSDEFPNYQPPPLQAAWISTPGVDPIIITVDLKETNEVSRIRLISITPPPEDYIILSAGRRGQWTPFFMFLGENGLEMEPTVSSQPFPWYTLIFNGPPYISQWSYNMSGSGVNSPVPADSIRITIKGPPVWSNSIQSQSFRKRRQTPPPHWIEYHALSEIQVFGRSPGCTCYSAGAAESGACESSGQCECRSDLDPLAGDECGPYVSSISPLFGPESGGTVITIQGQLLLEVQIILIGNQSCVIRQRSAAHITCRIDSSPHPLDDQPQNGYTIRIVHACNDILGQTYRFEYRPDPVVQSISPRQSFLSGGVVQTISGMHLDSVASPYLLAYVFDTGQTGRRKRQAATYDYFLVEIDDTLPDVENNDGLYAILTSLCNPISPTEMRCPIPPIPPPEGSQFSQAPSDVDQPQGRKMQSGCDMHDYKVTVGTAECSVYHLDASTMYCRAPTDEPRDAESIYGAPRVRVTVGFLYEQHTVGYLEYQSLWQSTEFYIGIGVAIAVIVIVIIVTVICCKARG